MITTISKQGGRRYPQLKSTIATDAQYLPERGTSAAGAVTVVFKKASSGMGTAVGKRQAIGAGQ